MNVTLKVYATPSNYLPVEATNEVALTLVEDAVGASISLK